MPNPVTTELYTARPQVDSVGFEGLAQLQLVSTMLHTSSEAQVSAPDLSWSRVAQKHCSLQRIPRRSTSFTAAAMRVLLLPCHLIAQCSSAAGMQAGAKEETA